MNTTLNASRLKMFATPDTQITALKTSGSHITTKEFGELIDFEAGCWAAVLGHNRPEVIQTISDHIGLLLHTHQLIDTEHPGALVQELMIAAELKTKYKGTFMSSGSEAVSLAIMLAELITKRSIKLSFTISYLGSCPELRLPRDPSKWIDLDIGECINCPKSEDCTTCGKFSAIDYSQFAAFVFEPGNSGGLVLCPPDKLIAYICKQVKQEGGFIIANEVTTGFGRTGKWFGFQHYSFFNTEQTSPDFLALGKGLGNGYPISSVLVRSTIAQQIEATGFRYVQSHTDDPLGCMIARKTIEVLKKENLIEQGRQLGEYLRQKLSSIPGISQVRGRGMMNVAILDRQYCAKDVFQALLDNGFFVGYSELYNFIHLYAPFIINKKEIDALYHALQDILTNKN